MNKFWNGIRQKVLGEKDLASIGVANIIGSGISAIFWFYIASIIEPAEYGEIHYFLGIAGIAQIFSLVATSNVFTVYTAKRIKIQSTLITISLGVSLVSAIILFLLFNRSDIIFLLFGYVIFEMINGILLGKKLFSTYAKIFLIQKILTISLGVIFYLVFGIEGIIFALALSYVPYIKIIVTELKCTKINFSLLDNRKGFLLNNYGLNLSGAMGSQLDKIVIAPLLGFELLGNYSLALQFFVILLILPNVVFKYLLSHDSSGKEKNELKKYTIFLTIGFAIIGVILLPLIIPITFPKFLEAIDAIRIMSIGIIPATISLIIQSKLLALEKSKFVLISKIINVLTILIGFISLGPIYGIIGLAVVFVLASTFESLFLFISSKLKRIENNE